MLGVLDPWLATGRCYGGEQDARLGLIGPLEVRTIADLDVSDLERQWGNYARLPASAPLYMLVEQWGRGCAADHASQFMHCKIVSDVMLTFRFGRRPCTLSLAMTSQRLETPMFSGNTSRAASISGMTTLDDNGNQVGHPNIPADANPDDDWIETQPPSDAGTISSDCMTSLV